MFGLGAAAFSTTSKAGPTARTLWKIADFGLTGYTIYDLALSFKKDDESVAIATRLTDAVVDRLTPPEVILAVSLPINDRNAVSLALARQGTAALSDEGNEDPFAGIVYLAASDYVMTSDGQPLLSPEDLHDALFREFGSVLIESGVSADDLAPLADQFSVESIRTMPLEMYLRFDYVVHALAWIADNISSDPVLAREFMAVNNPGSEGTELKQMTATMKVPSYPPREL